MINSISGGFMRHSLQEKCLTIFLEGEVNSLTSPSIESEINETIKDKDFSSLVLDFEKVEYLSSAGLRIILKLKQKYQDVSIINTSLEVYDILQMTGFVNVMNISKALRKVSVEGASLIGEGYFSVVYRINKDTIIKVFKRATDTKEIEQELALAKQAFILGIPTAISFDIVKVNDKYGVVFEMLDSVPLRDLFRDYPERYEELIQKYVSLVKTVTTTESDNTELLDAKKEWLNKLEKIKDLIDDKLYQKSRVLLESIPDSNTFIHGDCHFKNIMVQNEELFLIDMATLSKGNRIFEFASMYAPYVAFELDDPGNAQRFLGVPYELTCRIMNDLIKNCFGSLDESIIDKIRIVCYIHMMWWNRVNEPENEQRFVGNKERLISLVEKYEDLVI